MQTPLLTVLLTCVLATGVVDAQSPAPRSQEPRQSQSARETGPEPRPPFKWWGVDRIAREIKLTAEQSAEIDKIFQASMERLRVDKDDFDRAQRSFSELMQKGTVGDRDFERAVDQLELARYNVSKERTLMLVRIHNVLTPEQRKGLDTILKRNEGGRRGQQR